jgi:hypothetical protein
MGVNRIFVQQLITGSLLVISLCNATCVSGQSGKEPYLDNPIVVDSSLSLIIPVRYDASVFSSNKLAAWDNYYANLVFYNIQTDSSRRLFKNDTYIMDFRTPLYAYKYSWGYQRSKNITGKWILIRVKDVDHNRNGRMDHDDPDILYAADIYGKNLKCLSTANESVVSIQVFDQQNFAFIKFQRDKDHNKKYEYSDDDYFYVKLDLATLTLGQRIEVR